jgi:UDPglucose 6-dehydrogenase
MVTVAVVGTGYVGLVTGLAFVARGHRVLCVDVDADKVDAVNRGKPTFFEKGAEAALRSAIRKGALVATTDGPSSVRDSRFTFLCVGTPSRSDGSMDDTQIRTAARMVGEGLRGRKGGHTVVVKSTVLPGTTESVILPALREAAGPRKPFGLCVNPEFLREGSALEDARKPDRIVIGERDRASGDALEALYEPYRCPKLRCDLRTAEMVKYATNAFLATKISFANELANLSDRFGVNWDEVVKGVGLDPRISPRFLVPGVGFGGSCFPKDVAALAAAGASRGYDAALLREVLSLNDRQPLRSVDILEEELGDLKGKRIAVLGLAFKAGTDDVRESRAIPIVRELGKRGAEVTGFDSVAAANFAKAMPGVRLAASLEEALKGAHGCIIQADWPEFRRLAPQDFAGMTKRVVVDGRRTLDRKVLRGGIVYRRIG